MSELPPLWPHQEYALSALAQALAEGKRRICLTAVTGAGKSRIMFERISESSSHALYTNRRMLLAQLAGNMDKRGMTYGLRAAGHEPRLLEDIQLCMIQTEAARASAGRDVHPSQFVWIDECHVNRKQQMQALVARHAEARECAVIGVTATPLGVGHMFDHLIVAGSNRELRDCGALVPVYHYGPNEPDTKWIGKIAIGEGECGLPNAKRMEFAHRVFGSVVEWYEKLNPDYRPTVLFAPGVPESIWFAEELHAQGISAAHIDGKNCWLEGRLVPSDDEVREEIAARSQSGEIKVVSTRYVLREGIDWPWISHMIFATVFGSLTAYLQSGGRGLRACTGKDSCTVQDHGGNYWRHGSLNANREWKLGYTDAIVAGMREMALRQKKEREPITCPKCFAVRLSGAACYACGYIHQNKGRMVLQKDGSLREMKGDIFRVRRMLPEDERLKKEWRSRVKNTAKSAKPTVRDRTFAQLEASFARDHNFQYPSHDWPMMPVNAADWFRPVREVTELTGDSRHEYVNLESAATF